MKITYYIFFVVQTDAKSLTHFTSVLNRNSVNFETHLSCTIFSGEAAGCTSLLAPQPSVDTVTQTERGGEEAKREEQTDRERKRELDCMKRVVSNL